MMEDAVSDRFRVYKIVEPFIWLAVFSLLALSNIYVDVLLAFELSFALTFGMFVLSVANRQLLLPYLLLRRRMALYMLFSLLLISGAILLFSEIEVWLVNAYMDGRADPDAWSPLDCTLPSAESKPFFEEEPRFNMTSGVNFKVAILFLGSFFVSTLLHYFQKEVRDEQARISLLQEKTEMELKFLKSQINPHFLFNALNNIYSMVYMGDEKAADSVLALSEMLRYVTDESGSDKIDLADEVSYLDNYLDFQKIRYEKAADVLFEKNIRSEHILVSPMLFQPFIENAFKHSGVGSEADAYVRILLEADDADLRFSVVNSKKRKQGTQPSRVGVGLANVKKRLDLLYPGRYDLAVEEAEDRFSVKLMILL